MNEKTGECFDCGMPYGMDGWIEAVIPDIVWNDIRPEDSEEECGLLCISCMAIRLKKKGYKNVPVWLCGTEPFRAMEGHPSGVELTKPKDACKDCKYWGIDYENDCSRVDPEYRELKDTGFKVMVIDSAADDQGVSATFRTGQDFYCPHFQRKEIKQDGKEI